jgi:hypothetical protein
MQVHKFYFDYTKTKDFYFLLASDVHKDSEGFDEKRFRQDMDEIVNKNGRVYINGDNVNAIVKSDSKRYVKSGDKYANDGILNSITEELTEFYSEWVDYIDVIGIGNHEATIIKYHDYDIIRQVIINLNKIRSKSLAPIRHGGYSGFIRLSFHCNKKDSHVLKYDIFYNHGQGGNAEVTKGMISLQRRQYIISDLIWLGHTHTSIQDNDMHMVYLDKNANLCERARRGIITGTYKKPLRDYDIDKIGYLSSYGIERMRTPESSGGAILHIKYASGDIQSKIIS